MLAIAIVAYPSFQKHNPDLAAKTQCYYEIAKALVASQAAKEVSAEKKQAVASALLDQAKKSITKIT